MIKKSKNTNQFSVEGLGLSTSILARGAYLINKGKSCENSLMASYDSIASEYSLEMLSRKVRIEEMFLRKLLTTNKCSHMLDVGCGTGGLGKLIFNDNKNQKPMGCYAGCDLSIQMIKTALLSQQHQMNFYQASGIYLPFKSNIFDVVVSNLCLHHAYNQFEFISELKRVSNKNASIMFSVAGEFYLKEVVTVIIKTATNTKWFMKFLKHPIAYWPYTKGRLIVSIREHGFSDFAIDEVEWQYTFESIDELLKAFRSIAGEFYMEHLNIKDRQEFMGDVKGNLKFNGKEIKLTDHILFCYARI